MPIQTTICGEDAEGAEGYTDEQASRDTSALEKLLQRKRQHLETLEVQEAELQRTLGKARLRKERMARSRQQADDVYRSFDAISQADSVNLDASLNSLKETLVAAVDGSTLRTNVKPTEHRPSLFQSDGDLSQFMAADGALDEPLQTVLRQHIDGPAAEALRKPAQLGPYQLTDTHSAVDPWHRDLHAELTRLRSVYPLSHREYMLACAEKDRLTRVRDSLMFAVNQLASQDSRPEILRLEDATSTTQY